MDTQRDAEVVNFCKLGLARDRIIAINVETGWRPSLPSRREDKLDLRRAKIALTIGQHGVGR